MRTWIAVLTVVVMAAGAAFAAEAPAPQTEYQRALTAYQAASKLQQEKKTDEALAGYLDMLKTYPRSQYAWNAFMNALNLMRADKKYDQAVALAEQQLKDTRDLSQQADIIANIATLYGSYMREPAKAAALFERLATEFPGYVNAESCWWSAMNSLRSARDDKGAVRVIDACLKAMPNKGNFTLQMLYNKAQSQVNLDDLEGAAATVDAMNAVSPNDRMMGDPLSWIAGAYQRKKDAAKAAEFYLKAAKLPGFERAAASILTAADVIAAEKPEEAIKYCRQYLEEYPNGTYAHQVYTRMATTCRQYAKDREKELAVCQEFIGKHDKSVYLDAMLWTAAQAAEALKKNDVAKTLYQQLLDKCPASTYVPQTLYYLAQINRREKADAVARPLLERLVKEYAGYSYADNAAAQLKTMP